MNINIKENLKLLKEITTGWKNLLFHDKEFEPIAEKRMYECLSCIKLNRDTKKCKMCGCYMPAKVRSKSSKCPLNKWEQ
jgi:hypothetical protein